MATYREVIDRVQQLSVGIAQDAHQSALIDSEMTAEVVFPHAVRYALVRRARTGGDLSDLMTEQIISVANNEGVLPEEILKDALKRAIFPGKPMVCYATHADFSRFRFSKQLDYFSYFGDKFFYSAAGVPNYTGNVSLYTAAIPEMPTDEEDEVLLPAVIVEEVILIMAAVLRGETPLSALMDK